MKILKIQIIISSIFLLATSITFGSKLNINNQIITDGENYFRTLSSKIPQMDYLVRLRRNTEDYFDVLNLLIYLNQTSQLEQKLDVLIGESRKTNKLLERLLMEKTSIKKT